MTSRNLADQCLVNYNILNEEAGVLCESRVQCVRSDA